MVNILYVVAKVGFQDHELFETKGVLDSEGHNAVIASSSVGVCKGSFGGSVNADLSLKDALRRIDSFGAVVFIGGGGARAYQSDADALALARAAVLAGKVVGAICIAPTILAAAGVLERMNATVWDEDGNQSGFLVKHGARFTGDPVTVDGKIVTAYGPSAATVFGEALAKAITGSS